MLFALNALLIQRANQNQTTVLIIDEAHNLEWDVLEEVRLLGNLENRRGKMLQIILSGQRELDRKLEEREFRQLKQRIALRCHLRPLSAMETSQYIASRLARAGMREQNVFSPDVLAEIHLRTQGIPRLINSVCDNVLLTAFALSSRHATMDMIEEVSRDLHLDWPGSSPRIWEDIGRTAARI